MSLREITNCPTEPLQQRIWLEKNFREIRSSLLSLLNTGITSETDPVFLASAANDITIDVNGNMVFTDVVVGSRTLKQLGCPTYKYLIANGVTAGDSHLSNASWGVSKALILSVNIITVSTGYNFYLLQNDNGYAADDAAIPKVGWDLLDGNSLIKVNDCYQDEDGTNEIHIYYDGTESAKIIFKAIELL